MIYIPILKTRSEELRVIKNINNCFSEKIIPLIEIISEKYKVKYKTDENGEYIRKKVGSRMMRIKCAPSEKDIITLDDINNLVQGKTVFVDYFRFTLEKYGKNIDFGSVELSYNLNNNYELYKEKVHSITKYNNMIPVISVKKGYDISKNELIDLITDLQEKSKHTALRITEEWIETYKEVLQNNLREGDYLLFDVEEQNPKTKFMELEELNEYQLKCKIILLNSPRKADVKNGDYPEEGITDLINNCAKEVAEEYELNGYGDYCGLKDAMPSNNGSNGTGAALALLYDYKNNVFHSYCNHDTSLGMQGYKTIIPVIKGDEGILNKDGDCPGFEKISRLRGSGNWSTWHNINATRYIYQVYKYM